MHEPRGAHGVGRRVALPVLVLVGVVRHHLHRVEGVGIVEGGHGGVRLTWHPVAVHGRVAQHSRGCHHVRRHLVVRVGRRDG